MSLQKNREQENGNTKQMRFYFLVSEAVDEEDAERIEGYASTVDGNARVLELADPATQMPKRCIYVTDRSSGISRMDLAPVLEITEVESWLIVICGIKGKRSLAGFSVLRDTWEQNVGDLEASVSVIADDENCRKNILKWMQREIGMGDHGRICLLAASRGRVGRSLLRACLEKFPESREWQFEERLIQDSDYSSIRDGAARVVFVGSELNDFAIPYYDGGFRKSIFFLNKCDVQPVCYKDADGTRRIIMEILQDNGWDLSEEQFGQIHIGSASYADLYLDPKNWSALCSNFIAQEDFAMWDEDLLPACRNEYSLARVTAFMKRYDCMDAMARYLFSKEKAADRQYGS